MPGRTTRAALVAAVGLLAACAPPAHPGPDTLGGQEPLVDPPLTTPRAHLPGAEADPASPWSEPPADADTDCPSDWDPTPPADLIEGTTLVAELTCGLFEGSALKSWAFDGSVWLEQPGGLVEVRPEVIPCMQPGPKELVWTPDGDIEFDSASWQHAFKPTATPSLWLGQGTPYHALDADCRDALDELGLELPVTMTLEVVAVLTP